LSAIRVAIGAELLDGPICGMRIALDGFLNGVTRLARQDMFELIHGLPFDRACNYDGFKDTVIHRGYGFGSGLLWSQVKLPRALRRMGVDLVHWPYQILPPIYTPVPLVVSVWDLAPINFNEPDWGWLAVTGKYRTILRAALKNAAHVITHSYAIADEVRLRFRIPTSKITVIYPGLTPSFEKETLKQYQPTTEGLILYVGTGTTRKNLSLLFEAFAILVRQGVKNNLGLRVSFSESEKVAVEMTTARMGIPRHRIEFIPPATEESLLRIYQRAALFAFPSLYEGFGLPMIEAMACGLPVVALNRSTMPEVLGDTGVLVDDASPSAFARGITEAIMLIQRNDHETADRVKARAMKFQWTTTVRETLNVYESVYRNSRSGQS